jgi:hypothetical protein
LEQETFQAKL